MSDGPETRWKRVQKSLKNITDSNKKRQALSSEDWHLFLRTLKRDTRAVEKLSKFLDVRGESKTGEFRDSANARLTNFCQNLEKHKLQDAKAKKEDAKEAKQEAAPAADNDFTEVKGGNRQRQKQGQGSTRSSKENLILRGLTTGSSKTRN